MNNFFAYLPLSVKAKARNFLHTEAEEDQENLLEIVEESQEIKRFFKNINARRRYRKKKRDEGVFPYL